MCLALPARVVALLDGDEAQIDLGGVRKTVSIALVPDAQPGDYVIVHVGHAIGRIDPEEAERTLALFAEMAAAQADAEGDGGAALAASAAPASLAASAAPASLAAAATPAALSTTTERDALAAAARPAAPTGIAARRETAA